MLIDPDAVAKAIEIVDDSMFYREAHRRLFRAMARLFQSGQALDPVTVSEELKKTDELEVVGGLTYLARLLDAVPTAANLEYHARIVREKALLRRLIRSEEHTSELQSRGHLVCRLLLEKKKATHIINK